MWRKQWSTKVDTFGRNGGTCLLELLLRAQTAT